MAGEKRSASPSFNSSQIVKRKRSQIDINNDSAVTVGNSSNGALALSGALGSGLAHNTIEMTGHTGEVFAARFSTDGRHIASGSMDRSILLWQASGVCENYAVLKGHKNAVMDLHWSRDTQTLFSASADFTLASWDTETGQRIRRHEGHEDFINCMDVTRIGPEVLISGGDDGSISIWDPRAKHANSFMSHDFSILAVAISDAGNEIYSGSVDDLIHVWDIRKQDVVYSMQGHTDSISSLEVSPDGQSLLSHSFDGSVRTWDIKPFAPENRHLKTYDGAAIGIDKNLIRASWSKADGGQKITAGSGDGSCLIWETRTGKLLNKLPGHKGTVNDARISPVNSNLVLTASTDRSMILGEIAG